MIRPPWALAIIAIGGLAWGAWAWRADQRYQSAILEIELEMANDRFGIAARELNNLIERGSGTDEAAILLARCEQERGRLKAAAEALERVVPGSELSHKATLARMRLFHDQGQFAAAEDLIESAAADTRNDRAHVRVLLVPIYSQLGRIEEAKRLLEEWWERLDQQGEGASERAIDQVRMHIELDMKPNPVEKVREYLDQASRLAPDDDRVWLGQANLAIRTGSPIEATRWLDQCLKRRPSDVAVWSARLDLGIAASRTDLVDEAVKHLPANALTSARIHRLAAWFCSQRGDHQAERDELESVSTEDPGDLDALRRLTELAEKSAQLDRARELRGQSAEIERARARFAKLFDRNQPIRDAEEMAQLALRLGRAFEARAFLTIELEQDPDRDDLRQLLARLRQARTKPDFAGQTVAAVLAKVRGHDQKLDVTAGH